MASCVLLAGWSARRHPVGHEERLDGPGGRRPAHTLRPRPPGGAQSRCRRAATGQRHTSAIAAPPPRPTWARGRPARYTASAAAKPRVARGARWRAGADAPDHWAQPRDCLGAGRAVGLWPLDRAAHPRPRHGAAQGAVICRRRRRAVRGRWEWLLAAACLLHARGGHHHVASAKAAGGARVFLRAHHRAPDLCVCGALTCANKATAAASSLRMTHPLAGPLPRLPPGARAVERRGGGVHAHCHWRHGHLRELL